MKYIPLSQPTASRPPDAFDDQASAVIGDVTVREKAASRRCSSSGGVCSAEVRASRDQSLTLLSRPPVAKAVPLEFQQHVQHRRS